MTPAEVVVAGHLCLDLIPDIGAHVSLEPGNLSEVGPLTFAPGGGVANVGSALTKLGVRAHLVAQVGDDALGTLLRRQLQERVPQAHLSVQTCPESTSYTVVISPPTTDRVFLHHSGCNDTFSAGAIDLEAAAGARIFYFGYPPLMAAIYRDGGRGLAELLAKLQTEGVLTVLDFAMPDPGGQSGRVDWHAFLANVLPRVDVVTPSLDELCVMLGEAQRSSHATWSTLAEALLSMGTKAVALTLGEQGLYLRTGDLSSQSTHPLLPHEVWSRRELLAPIFQVDVRGATGAGDASAAGLIAALLRGQTPEEVVTSAVAVGACSVEAADASSGVRNWDETQTRVRAGWSRGEVADEQVWRHVGGAWLGPHDVRSD